MRYDVGSLEIEIIISVSHAQLERKLFSLLTHLDYTHTETHVRYPSGFSPPPPLSGYMHQSDRANKNASRIFSSSKRAKLDRNWMFILKLNLGPHTHTTSTLISRSVLAYLYRR